MLFQRAKIQDKCKQFTTPSSNTTFLPSCFKEQRYKINASNSQLRSIYAVQVMVVSKSKDKAIHNHRLVLLSLLPVVSKSKDTR